MHVKGCRYDIGSIHVSECNIVPRTLLLDLDGTLVDTVPDLTRVLNRLMRARSLPLLSPAEVTSMIGDGVAVLVGRAFARHGRSPDKAAVADFSADYAAHVAVDSKLYPHVAPVLRAMRDDGWALAVCTNKPESAARELLDAVGLLPLLCAVGGGDSFPVRKPDPGHLLGTLARANGSVDRAVMLGDHRNDVVAARAAGIASIFASWGYGCIGMADGSAAVASDIVDGAGIANQLLPVSG
jgi:phosphoglycolate phosphatase